jgi:uncharacterized delta-60 repeat protein
MRLRSWIFIATAAVSLLAAAPATTALDPTFSDDGILIPDVRGQISGLSMEGTALVATGFVDTTPAALAAFRITSDGQLDSSFSDDGVFTLAGFGGEGVGIVPRATGGYWVGGWVRETTFEANKDFALLALTSAGGIDTSYGGGDGLVVVDLGRDEVAAAMTLDPAGRILLAGTSIESGGSSGDAAVVRFTSAGQPDGSFGGDGAVTYPGGPGGLDGARDVATSATGQPLVVGTSEGGDVSPQLVLARLEDDGDLDSTFGDEGLSMPDLAPHSIGEAIKVLPTGKILVGATVWGNPTASTPVTDLLNFAVLRTTSNGSLDESFGTGGDGSTVTSVGKEDRVAGVATFSDGSILVAGSSGGSIADHAFVRYTRQGAVDPLFGKKLINLWEDQFGNRSDDDVMALMLLADDRYVVAGTSWLSLNGTTGYRIALARYRGAGLACTKVGTAGNDTIRGTAKKDILCGIGGADEIRGVEGADRIYGGPGNDSLYGGEGKDVLFGEAGSDLMNGGSGDDVCRDSEGANQRISC